MPGSVRVRERLRGVARQPLVAGSTRGAQRASGQTLRALVPVLPQRDFCARHIAIRGHTRVEMVAEQ